MVETTNKVKVISSFDGRCGIDNADLRISRRWPARGSSVEIDKEILEELMYDPAFKNMIDDGTLYIENMEVKKKLGIEPEDAKEPTIIYLGDKELERFWKIMPLSQFKVEVKKLTKAQIQSLADYAMKNGEEGSIQKANYLSEISGRNILKGIELQKSIKEG
jgi:hypothetical protein